MFVYAVRLIPRTLPSLIARAGKLIDHIRAYFTAILSRLFNVFCNGVGVTENESKLNLGIITLQTDFFPDFIT